ncbi:MAG: hypothetical protein QG604_644 [Candidatus Dependentiae bacterium]|nr:hypothetical protein [Candidatus Dependentiae bacterium]
MAKHVGVKIPDDLFALLKTERAVGVLATFSEKGVPHTTPLQCIYPKGRESLLIAIHKDHTGYHNMVWQKKVMISFLGDNNIAYSVLGRAGVVRAPSYVHPMMNVVRIDIIDIKCDQSVLTKVDKGVQWSFTSVDAQDVIDSIFQELRELGRTL